MHLIAGCVMEGSTMFCQKNILGHSMMFHGDDIKRCLLTIMVSQILSLTQLISDIKNIVTAANRLFLQYTHSFTYVYVCTHVGMYANMYLNSHIFVWVGVYVYHIHILCVYFYAKTYLSAFLCVCACTRSIALHEHLFNMSDKYLCNICVKK